MAQEKDLYRILGVSKNASVDEIKSSYRKLARENHPDRNPDDAKAEERFKEISVAYEVLGNEEKRKLYDEFGLAGIRSGFDADQARQYKQWGQGNPFGGSYGGGGFGGGMEFDLSSLFDQMFTGRSGGGGRGGFGGGGFGGGGNPWGAQQPKPKRGTDKERTISIDFMEAVLGGKHEITVPSNSSGSQVLTISIPPGVDNHSKIRLARKGNPGKNGGPPGDLILRPRVGNHPIFKRDENNLLLTLPITAFEAYKGTRVEVPTPTGSVDLRIPPGSQSGQKLRLRKKGIAAHKKKPAGDMIVELQIVIPQNEDPEVASLLEQLQGHYEKDVREGLLD